MKKYLLLLLFLASFGNALTLDEIITQVRIINKDNNSDAQLQAYSSATLTTWINEAQEDAVFRTGCLEKRATIDTNTSSFEYTISTDCIVPIRVHYNTGGSTITTKYDRLDYATIEELDRDYNYWEVSSSNVPKNYYYRADKIGLYPPPSASYSGTGYLRIDYVKRPHELVNGSDIPFDNQKHLYPLHHLLKWYVSAVIKYKEGDKVNGDFYWTKYLADLEFAMKRYKSRPDKDGNFKL